MAAAGVKYSYDPGQVTVTIGREPTPDEKAQRVIPGVAITMALAGVVLAGVDDELAELFERTRPTPEQEEETRRWKEQREQERRVEEDKRLRELVRNALEGIYGRGVRDAALEIIREGQSTAHLQRIRKLVAEWRRAGRAKKRETKAKTKVKARKR